MYNQRTLFEFDQIGAGIEFASLDELIAHARTLYLRDKKNVFYCLVITQDLDTSVLSRLLSFLDEGEVSEIPFSENVPALLISVAEIEMVRQLLTTSVAGRYENVVRCLVDELTDITFASETMFSPVLRAIEGAPQTVVAELAPLEACLRLSSSRPDIAVRNTSGLLAEATQSWWRLSTAAVDSLSSIARMVGLQSHSLQFAQAFAAPTSEKMRLAYRNPSVQPSSAARLMGEGAGRAAEVTSRVAHEVLGWSGEWSWPFPWRIVWQSEPRRDLLLDLVELQYRPGDLSATGVLPSGFPFTIEWVERPESMRLAASAELERVSREGRRRWDFEYYSPPITSRVAFWLKFPGETETAVALLRSLAAKPENRRRFSGVRDVVRWVRLHYEYWGSEEVRLRGRGFGTPDWAWSALIADFYNYVTLVFCETDLQSLFANGEQLRSDFLYLVSRLRENYNIRVARTARRHSRIPDPVALLTNNLLHWALANGEVQLADAAKAALGQTVDSEREICTSIRLIV